MIDGELLVKDVERELRAIWHPLVVAHETSEGVRRLSMLIRAIARMVSSKQGTLNEAMMACRQLDIEMTQRREMMQRRAED